MSDPHLHLDIVIVFPLTFYNFNFNHFRQIYSILCSSQIIYQHCSLGRWGIAEELTRVLFEAMNQEIALVLFVLFLEDVGRNSSSAGVRHLQILLDHVGGR